MWSLKQKPQNITTIFLGLLFSRQYKSVPFRNLLREKEWVLKKIISTKKRKVRAYGHCRT
ncbi:MAG: hypothetical protein AMJ91_02590 [candidate division Zixibacteria bacterium SM23_73_3]|nr:MAG: hypothetical protein AMJ91_02590 [candidate division Zixibacteria bacterium SM23_73_3]